MNFLYTERVKHYPRSGTGRIIRVYRMKNNEPHYIGKREATTISWRGAYAVACLVISENLGHKMDPGDIDQGGCMGWGYNLVRKDIQVRELL